MQIKSISCSSYIKNHLPQNSRNVIAIRNVETRDQSRNRIDYLKNRMLIRDDLQDASLKARVLGKSRANMHSTATQGFGAHQLYNTTNNAVE